MVQATHLARTTAADRTMVQATGTQRALSHAPGTQYHLVQSPQTYVNDVAAMLAEAVWYIDAAAPGYSGGQTIPNLGTGGSALDATLGSTGGSDTNDPAWLDHTGTNYVWLPGVAGNYLSVHDSAALDITGDIDIRVHCSAVDWSTGTRQTLLGKYGSTGYLLEAWTAGELLFGITGADYAISSAHGLTDGVAAWVRVTRVQSSGLTTFYKSTDGTSWTTISTHTIAAGDPIGTNSAVLFIGDQNGPFAGSVYRAVIYSDLTETTTVLDVDTSVITGSSTTFTEQSSNAATVTINRSSSGRKAVAVTQPVFALGSDDFIETPDHADLDMGASDSFTVLAVVRQWATQPTSTLLSKKGDLGSTAGYALYHASGSDGFIIADGTVDRTRTATPTLGALATVAGVRDTTADVTQVYYNGTGSATTSDTTTATLANTGPLRVGSLATGVLPASMEFTAAAIWRRALTGAEIAAITTYFQTRG